MSKKPTEKQAAFFAFNEVWRHWEKEADEILGELGISKEDFKNGNITREQASDIIGLTYKKIE